MPQPITQQFAVTQDVVTIVKHYEGYTAKAYHQDGDRPNVFTGGFGSVMHQDGTPIKDGETMSEQQWEDLMLWELNNKAVVLNGLFKTIAATQDMFSGCLDFTYNEGVGTFTGSSIYKKMLVNPMDKTIYDYALDSKTGYGVPLSCSFLNFTVSDGVRLQGLVKRRTTNAHLYITGEVILF